MGTIPQGQVKSGGMSPGLLSRRPVGQNSNAFRGEGIVRGIFLLPLMLAGCATIIEGTSQSIMVEVVPDTGSCAVMRQGAYLGKSSPGQRLVTVSKSYYDLEFDCSAPGY